MATIAERIQAEIDRANSITGKADTTVHDSVGSLINGYGQGIGSKKASYMNINFYDFDGTVIDTWTLDELKAKIELPQLPTHDRLTAQEWNWTLDELKEDGTPADVYVLYEVTSGLSEFDICLTKGTGLTVSLYQHGNIDWGDGSSSSFDESTTDFTHTYSDYGSYTITWDGCVLAGELAGSQTNIFGGKSSDLTNYVVNIRIGNRITSYTNGRYFGYITRVNSIVFSASINLKGNYIWYGSRFYNFVTFPRNPAFSFDSMNELKSKKIVMPKNYSIDNNINIRFMRPVDGEIILGKTIDGFSNIISNDIKILNLSHTNSVPTVSESFVKSIVGQCKVLVKSSLVDQFRTETNWVLISDQIVGVG